MVRAIAYDTIKLQFIDDWITKCRTSYPQQIRIYPIAANKPNKNVLSLLISSIGPAIGRRCRFFFAFKCFEVVLVLIQSIDRRYGMDITITITMITTSIGIYCTYPFRSICNNKNCCANWCTCGILRMFPSNRRFLQILFFPFTFFLCCGMHNYLITLAFLV